MWNSFYRRLKFITISLGFPRVFTSGCLAASIRCTTLRAKLQEVFEYVRIPSAPANSLNQRDVPSRIRASETTGRCCNVADQFIFFFSLFTPNLVARLRAPSKGHFPTRIVFTFCLFIRVYCLFSFLRRSGTPLFVVNVAHSRMYTRETGTDTPFVRLFNINEGVYIYMCEYTFGVYLYTHTVDQV